MQRTISKQLNIIYLDDRLNKCDSATATMQLESYYTIEEPNQKIGHIGPLTREFTYDIGNNVNVESKIFVNRGCMLTNVIRTKFLQEYIRTQR